MKTYQTSKREFGPRGRNFAKAGRTIDRWIKAGKFPRPDLVLPGNEKAWYEVPIDSWEQSRSADWTTDRRILTVAPARNRATPAVRDGRAQEVERSVRRALMPGMVRRADRRRGRGMGGW